MKRKEYQDKYDSFSLINLSSPSSKSRRLDPGLSIIKEEEEEFPVDPIPQLGLGSSANDEKAIVVYNPMFKSPTPSNFSLVLNSDFKDHLLSLEKPKLGMLEERFDYAPDDSLAVVPWVASRAGAVTVGPPPPPSSLPEEEVEEAEMMDVDVDVDEGGESNGEFGGGLQHWHQQQQQQQQHWLRPDLVHNPYTPVAW